MSWQFQVNQHASALRQLECRAPSRLKQSQTDSCLLKVPGQSKCSQTSQRKETAEFWPYMDLINKTRTDAEAGTSEMGEDTLKSACGMMEWLNWSVFEEDGRGNMKGSRFLWRQVGFSRRSRIFPRNPTPGNDFPTTLEMGRVPRRPCPFWGLKCSQSRLYFILMNKLCLCWHHDFVHCWGLDPSCFGPWSSLDDMTCPFWGKLFHLMSSLNKLSNHACASPVYLNGERLKFQQLVCHTYFAITQGCQVLLIKCHYPAEFSSNCN